MNTNMYIGRADTSAWIMQVWASFGLAVLVTCMGIYNLPVDLWVRGYVAMGFFFTVGSTFTLAKMIRDNAEAQQGLPSEFAGSPPHESAARKERLAGQGSEMPVAPT